MAYYSSSSNPPYPAKGGLDPSKSLAGRSLQLFGWLYHMSRGGASNTQGVASRRQGVESKVNGFLTTRVNLSRNEGDAALDQ